MRKRTGQTAVRKLKKEIRDLKKAIKGNCYDCMGNHKQDCKLDKCYLYPYQPYKKR